MNDLMSFLKAKSTPSPNIPVNTPEFRDQLMSAVKGLNNKEDPSAIALRKAIKEQKDMMKRLAMKNQGNAEGSGGIGDSLGYTDGQFGRKGGLIDQYKTGSGLFGMLGGGNINQYGLY